LRLNLDRHSAKGKHQRDYAESALCGNALHFDTSLDFSEAETAKRNLQFA
jgi:hypothetical protein